jgi:hypothetical protein
MVETARVGPISTIFPPFYIVDHQLPYRSRGIAQKTKTSKNIPRYWFTPALSPSHERVMDNLENETESLIIPQV